MAQVAPPEHRRGPEQTFLTYPEWFLVHSPAEYAVYVREHTPTLFPFVGHVCQFWQGYGAVYDATKKDYPFNFGYHVMVMVIGTSTSVEYALRAAYETLIGRLSELTVRQGVTAEDRYGAAVAQDYVNFIRDLPWYEYDFAAALAGLWKTPVWGANPLRKWERRYALGTEYIVKGLYGFLIKKATKASYDAPLMVTAVVVDRLPAGLEKKLPQIELLRPLEGEAKLILVPRYEAFMRYASGLAANGARFQEIAGNRSVILVSALVPRDWQPAPGERVLFEQPILTQPVRKRIALVVPVAALAATLNAIDKRGDFLEHVYDY